MKRSLFSHIFALALLLGAGLSRASGREAAPPLPRKADDEDEDTPA
jgi:hypothetical protein